MNNTKFRYLYFYLLYNIYLADLSNNWKIKYSIPFQNRYCVWSCTDRQCLMYVHNKIMTKERLMSDAKILKRVQLQKGSIAKGFGWMIEKQRWLLYSLSLFVSLISKQHWIWNDGNMHTGVLSFQYQVVQNWIPSRWNNSSKSFRPSLVFFHMNFFGAEGRLFNISSNNIQNVKCPWKVWNVS